MTVGRAAHACTVILLALIAKTALAAPPRGIVPDPELQAWFQTLRQPTTKRLCCSVSDCRFVAFEIHDGHYEIWIDGWRYAVPAKTNIPDIANPTGRAVACYTFSGFEPPLPVGVPRDHPQDTIELLCFIPPRPLS